MGVILGQGDEPQRQLGKVRRHRVAVHPVEATLRHQTAGEDALGFVGRNFRHRVMGMPGGNQGVGQLPAGLHQKGTGAPSPGRTP